jgi:hypothetical protein
MRSAAFAAAFALRGANSTACPAGYLPLDTMQACVVAAAAANGTSPDLVTYSYYPAGCFWHTFTGKIYFNGDTAGAANSFAQPLCTGVAQGTLAHHQRI